MSNAQRWYAHGPLTGNSSAVYPLDVPITEVVLASEYEAVVAALIDRDGDLALMRAERDALKATVDRVSQSVNIHRDCLYCHGPECCTHAREVADALAGGECGLCHAEPHNYGATAHGFGKCVERRKSTRRGGGGE